MVVLWIIKYLRYYEIRGVDGLLVGGAGLNAEKARDILAAARSTLE